MQETGWKDMKIRRAIHKLLLYFKIVNNLLLPITITVAFPIYWKNKLFFKNCFRLFPFSSRTELF